MASKAPLVVALVVAHDPGPWFEEALGSLARQDYPRFEVEIVDAASAADLAPRVNSVLPGAHLRRLGDNEGFGVSINRSLAGRGEVGICLPRPLPGSPAGREAPAGAEAGGRAEGNAGWPPGAERPTHYVLCHDDVALAPDAVRLMVEEAYRSNAALVSPKMVSWHAPDRLVDVGATVDGTGCRVSLVDPGELDQAQHDSVRDVLVAPGGCVLARADLLVALGGVDTAMPMFGEDIDLSLRSRVAGGRVIVAPQARVRHLGATSRGIRRLGPARWAGPGAFGLELRGRLRVALVTQGRLRLAGTLA
ncbi:MAG: glycosyltransferase family 2 protein, partial [Acidimicrobiales bacterium]